MSKTVSAPARACSSHATDACKALFGRLPEDVLLPLKSTSDALDWLNELCRTIAQEAKAMRAPGAARLATLAEAARHIAIQVGELADYEHEEMKQCLVQAGLLPPAQGENA